MSDVYGTPGNDTIDGTGFPELTNIYGLAGDDYIIVGRYGGGDGGPGNDTIVGGVNVDGPGVNYSNSPKGIKVNFSTGKVEDGFGTIDTLLNIKTVQGSYFADTVLGGASGDNFWASLNGDQIDGLTGKLAVTYYGNDPYSLNIDYSVQNNEFRISNPKNPGVQPDVIKNVLGIRFFGPNYTYPLLTPSNVQDFKSIGETSNGFSLKSTTNFSNRDATHFADTYVAGDFNGDGFQDIAIFRLNFTPNPYAPVQILVGDGTGVMRDGTKQVFGDNVPFTNFVARALVADLNSDGLDDLFCIDTGADTPPFTGGQNKLFVSNGRGNLIDKTSLLPSITTFNHGGAIADVNNDGKLDILINSLSRSVANNLYVQDKSGSFIVANDLLPSAVVGDGSTTSKVFDSTWSALIDLNLDGQKDLILGAWLPDQLSRLYFGDKSSAFKNSTYSELPPSGVNKEIVQQIHAIDLNGDDLPDLAISTTNGDVGSSYRVSYIQLLVNKGNGKFVDETQLRLPQSTSPSVDNAWYKFLVITDLDRDGKSDIVALSEGTAGLKAYMNDGSGKFFKEFSRGYSQVYGTVADLNNDGMDDFVTSTPDASSVTTWINNKPNGHIYKANFGGETLRGSATGDSFFSRDGNDLFDGRGGVDTAFYRLAANNYVITKATTNGATSYTVKDKTGADGTDTLQNMERLKFADTKVALDVGATQSAGQTALLLGAVLPGKLYLDASKQGLVGSVIDLFDQGFTLQQLSGALMRLPIWDVLTGKANPTSTDIASYLLTNVNEAAPNAVTLQSAVATLSSQTGASQGDFLAQLAASEANQAHVGLVGLAATGLLFG